MHKEILGNLTDFYRDAASFQGLELQQLFEMHFVHNRNAHWPNALIGNCNAAQATEVLEKMNKRLVPPFWIMDTSHAEVDQEWLAKKGCREVQRWEGMWCDKTHFTKVPLLSGEAVSLRPVNAKNALLQWGSLVQKVMMPNKVLDLSLLEAWLNCSRHRLMLIFENDKPVAGGLMYLKEQSAGIYFIATLPDYQRKGYGSAMVSSLVDEAFSAGADRVVLHASAAGLKMYLKLGFVPEGPISTYWKIGIF